MRPAFSFAGVAAMVTAADVRRAALALAGTLEAPHFDRTAFKVRRIYATMPADGKTST
jgi:phosphopantothenate synthetase